MGVPPLAPPARQVRPEGYPAARPPLRPMRRKRRTRRRGAHYELFAVRYPAPPTPSMRMYW